MKIGDKVRVCNIESLALRNEIVTLKEKYKINDKVVGFTITICGTPSDNFTN